MISNPDIIESSKQITTGHCGAYNDIDTLVLSTSLVTIQSLLGDATTLRALFGSGSQTSFLREDVANALVLPTQRS